MNYIMNYTVMIPSVCSMYVSFCMIATIIYTLAVSHISHSYLQYHVPAYVYIIIMFLFMILQTCVYLFYQPQFTQF